MITPLPAITNRELRRSIYDGKIYRIAKNQATDRLAATVIDFLRSRYGDNFRLSSNCVDAGEFYEAISQLKTMIYANLQLKRMVRDAVASAGFMPEENLFDPPRLRAVPSGGHENAQLSAVYSVHRDTWFANPQSQINWWLALHDASEDETFSFYPGYFAHPIANDSNQFDYGWWSKNVGFGRSHEGNGALYPTVSVPFELFSETSRTQLPQPIEGGSRLRFSLSTGEMIVFSAAHLHRTNPHASGKTRFSVDFRTVHMDDHVSGVGAPNVDNESRGSALHEYLRFAELDHVKEG